MDGEDFLEEPYSFGECKSYEFTANVRCWPFATTYKKIHVSARKRGNWVTVIIPDIMGINGGSYPEDILIYPFLPAELMGNNPRKRMFGTASKNIGIKGTTEITVNTIIRMYEDGNIKIVPYEHFINSDGTISYNMLFKNNKISDNKLGSFTAQFTYVIDDGHECELNFTGN